MASMQLQHPLSRAPSTSALTSRPSSVHITRCDLQKPFTAAHPARSSTTHVGRKDSRWQGTRRGPTCSASSDPTVVTTSTSTLTADEIKQQLLEACSGINRGIFGVQAAKAQHITSLVEQLESLNPLDAPTQHLDRVAGKWRLLYSTITIQGSKRTKLGLREFISLGDFLQTIDVEKQQAVNEVAFNVTGFGLLGGKLSILATYRVSSPTRVDIVFEQSTLVPDQLQRLFEKNYDLLLSIFNPEGWLEITYVDGDMRVGRDDKGNMFVLERLGGEEGA